MVQSIYGADPAEVTRRLGENWTELDPTTTLQRLAAFAELMADIQQSQGQD